MAWSEARSTPSRCSRADVPGKFAQRTRACSPAAAGGQTSCRSRLRPACGLATWICKRVEQCLGFREVLGPIAMCYQTSYVSVTSERIRRVTPVLAVLSFLHRFRDQRHRECHMSIYWPTLSRLRKNSEISSSRGAGLARELGIHEHGIAKSMARPVFLDSGPGPAVRPGKTTPETTACVGSIRDEAAVL